jgi:hypothetical protein
MEFMREVRTAIRTGQFEVMRREATARLRPKE